MNSLYVSLQPFLFDGSVVTKSVVTPDVPVLLLEAVSVMMLMHLILLTGLTANLQDPSTAATPAVVSLVRDHCRAVEMFEAAGGAGISDDLQVKMLDMSQQGLLQDGGKLTFVTFIITSFS